MLMKVTYADARAVCYSLVGYSDRITPDRVITVRTN